MLRRILETQEQTAPALLRLALGLVMFPHGAQKLLGWFGGAGPSATLDFFAGSLGIPAFLGVLVIMTEFFGSIALILGAFSRLAALGIGIILATAAFLAHAPNGFFMNWYGSQAGEGFEYHILGVTLALALVIMGSGRLSVDRLLLRTSA
ncbi:MAG TPA: DoxX family protein [Gemmatimonadales bacterium]|nr:DoxX family protein [Gemmatimonadales bacterium]